MPRLWLRYQPDSGAPDVEQRAARLLQYIREVREWGIISSQEANVLQLAALRVISETWVERGS